MTPEEKKQKTLARRRAWYADNRARLTARRLANRDERNAKDRAARAANRDAYNAKKRAYREANRKKINELNKARRNLDIERTRKKYRDDARSFRTKHPERIREWKKKSKKIRVSKITDGYVAELIGLTLTRIPTHLIEAKREQLLTYRCIKQLETTIKQKEKS